MAKTAQQKQKELSDFLYQAHVKESVRAGHPVSQSDFARRIGISHNTLSMFMTMNRLPSEESRDTLAAYFGPVIYDMLEVPRRIPPDPELTRIINVWGSLPTDARKRLAKLVESEADAWEDKVQTFGAKAKGVTSETK